MKRRRDFKRRIHKQPKSKFNLFALFKNINIFKYLSIFLIILFIISIPAVIKRLIKIDKIECNSQFGPCRNDYQLGDFNFVKRQIENDLSNNIKVNSYLIQYKIPSTIKIDVSLKKPKYAIKNLENIYFDRNKLVYFLVDNDGVVLEISNTSDLPNLVNNSTYQIGQKISDKDLFVLKLLEKIRIINTVTNAEIKNTALEVVIENGILVRLPLEGDIDVLTGSLKLIFSRLNEASQGIRMEDISEIDLRFKNPVLR